MFNYFDFLTSTLKLSGVDTLRLAHWDQAEGGVDIYVVDGKRIRDTMDIAFEHGGHHLKHPYIPQNEVWVDREAPGAGEQQFWALRQLYERTQLLNGASEALAAKRGRAMEAELRQTQYNLQLNFVIGELPDYLGFKVKIVSGKRVRNIHDVDFALGANGYKDYFVSKAELWVDDALLKSEWAPVVAHHGHYARAKQRGATHSQASALGFAVERACRAANSQLEGWDLPPGQMFGLP